MGQGHNMEGKKVAGFGGTGPRNMMGRMATLLFNDREQPWEFEEGKVLIERYCMETGPSAHLVHDDHRSPVLCYRIHSLHALGNWTEGQLNYKPARLWNVGRNRSTETGTWIE